MRPGNGPHAVALHGKAAVRRGVTEGRDMRTTRSIQRWLLVAAFSLAPVFAPSAGAQEQAPAAGPDPALIPPEGARSGTDVELFDYVVGRAGATGEVLEAEAKADRALGIGLVTVGDLTGRAVLGEESEAVGEIERIVRHDGQVWAVIEEGGLLGVGGHEVPVEVERLLVTPDHELRVRGLTEEIVEAAPATAMEGAENLPAGLPLADLADRG